MPNSLRAEIKKLKHKGKITDEECTRLLSKLDGHDKAIMPQWIPCSYGLPDVGVNVLVCFEVKKKRYVSIAEMFGDKEFHGFDDEFLTPEGKTRKAVAWMPLPNPYKEDQDGSDGDMPNV